MKTLLTLLARLGWYSHPRAEDDLAGVDGLFWHRRREDIERQKREIASSRPPSPPTGIDRAAEQGLPMIETCELVSPEDEKEIEALVRRKRK